MKPILFNANMVRAILDGRKTVTRRIVKLKYSNTHLEMRTDKYGARLIELQNEEPGVTTIKNPDGTTTHTLLSARVCHPPYRPGDILYVRETWAENPHPWDGAKYVYRASIHPADYDLYKWLPSIHMPREAARIFLRVTDVRVERVQQITDEQATVEGIRFTDFGMYQPSWKASLDGGKTFHPAKPIHHPGYHAKDVFKPEQCFPTARGAFANLWDSTIKPADRERYGWAANPWVWVIEFERCEKQEEA